MAKMKPATARKVGVGVGLAAAAAAAAAGAYFLYGKNGAKNRRMVKSWMLKARGEIMERMEQLEQVSEASYHEIVDSVLKGYKGMRNVSPADLVAAAAELKSQWNSIRRSSRAAASKKSAGSRRRTTAKSSGKGKK